MPQTAPLNLKKYLNANLFEELNLHLMPEEERNKFLDSFLSVIQMRIIRKLFEVLTDVQKNELEGILKDNEDGTKLEAFLKEELPDFENMVQMIIASYKHELIEQYKSILKTP